jgi:uncharacterized protein (DUF2384 family)
MARIDSAPRRVPTDGPELRNALLELISKALAMGLIASDGATDISRATLGKVLDALQTHRLGEDSRIHLAPLLHKGVDQLDSAVAGAMTQKVHDLSEALSRSPAPATEWSSMRQTLGDDALAGLGGISRASLRRYANGERATPQLVAERLHWIAMVVAELAGSYNEFGIRRWFERPRQQLEDRSPRQILKANWTPDCTEALRIKELSAVLI